MSLPKRPVQRIACIGEVMIELIAHEGGTATLGIAGDTYNTAVYLARALGEHDAGVSYVTALGVDPYSERIRSAIEAAGIGTDCIEWREGRMPGLYAIETDEEGERSFHYWRSDSAARSLFASPSTVTLESLRRFDLVFLTGISMAILPHGVREAIMEWIDGFRERGGTVAYDSNHRTRLWDSAEAARKVNEAMWSRTDIALPSVDDEMELFGDADADAVIDRLRGLGAGHGALKCGADGPVDLATGERPRKLESVKKVVDSTGAGDSFNAAYLAALVQGESEAEAAKAGHGLAARVLRYRGAIIPDST